MQDRNALLIKAGRVIDPANDRDETADILVVDGTIQDIGRLTDIPADTEIIDADGLTVIPGLVDMHVHLRDPGYEYKETIAGGSEAAAAGGVTAMATMANTKPVADDITVIRFILEKARLESLVNIFPIGAISKGLKGDEITEMGLLKKAGCVAFSDDGFPVMKSGVMRRALEYSRAFDVPVIQHAEDLSLVGCGCMNEGLICSRLGLQGIPNASEAIIVDRDLRLAELTGGRYHVAHISTLEAMEAVGKAQKKGLRVTCEAAPHHFTLTDTDIGDYNTNAKMAPPLRSQQDRNAIREGLARGIITAIATDHAPHDEDSKRVEFCNASNGVVGLETMLPLTLALVRDGVLTWKQAIAAVSWNPAGILGINRGTLSIGRPADITILAPEERWTVTKAALHGTAKNSCFIGHTMRGQVQKTLVSGRLVYSSERGIIRESAL
ncbi:MAG: dihydroorotase [Magnetococcales bacterium]|nr:dihydroorotase [Magnetococcales bacterium]